MMDNILNVRDLSKTFPGFSLNRISFQLPKGHILGLIGPNGAGKTTIIKLLLNLLVRDEGEITVFGLDNLEHEVEVKSRIGFVHDTPNFYGFMRLKEISSIIAGFYPKWDWTVHWALLERYGLEKRTRFRTLSRGMKMKFSLALALSHHAEFIILDEPTVGLDPVFRRHLLSQFSELIQDGHTSILISTHITSDLDRLADYIAFVREGELDLFFPKDELLEQWGVVKGDPKLLSGGTEHLFRGIRITEFGFEGLTDNTTATRQQFGEDILIERPSLEDLMVFLDRRHTHDSPTS